MNIPRYNEMLDYWSKKPPIHIMLASFFGVGKEKMVDHQKPQMGFAEFVGMFPTGMKANNG
jgi:hypothetical protein